MSPQPIATIGGQAAFVVARRLRRAGALVWLAMAGGACAGCSTAIPLPSLMGSSDRDVTGSIRQVSPLSPALDAEDWRRAQGALAVALDPQGAGGSVAWDNPQSKTKGSFAPAGQPRAVDDRICRLFTADLGGSHPTQTLKGEACRDKAGEWTVRDVEPLKKA